MLKISNLFFTVETREILSNISLEVPFAEKLLIMGASGSGKSTLLKMIMFFEVCTSGSIYFKDEEVNQNNIIEYRKKFSYLAQRVSYYLGTVKDFLYFPLKFKSNAALKVNNEQLNELFEFFSLPVNFLEKDYNKLSDGEKQRICLIQQILMKREFILLDEATSNLDDVNRVKIAKYLTMKTDQTLITVSHDSIWKNFCGRVLYMNNGKLSEKS